MTTYILHGGVALGTQQLLANMSFWPEALKKLAKPIKVLCIYAAIPEDRWDLEFALDQNKIVETAPPGAVVLEKGSAQVDTLVRQIQAAQFIYLRGGTIEQVLKSTFAGMQNLAELFRGKTVAGTSAGAYILAAHGLTRSLGLIKGLGLVPCKVAAHYVDSAASALELLRSTGKNLPVYVLRDGEYVTIEA